MNKQAKRTRKQSGNQKDKPIVQVVLDFMKTMETKNVYLTRDGLKTVALRALAKPDPKLAEEVVKQVLKNPLVRKQPGTRAYEINMLGRRAVSSKRMKKAQQQSFLEKAKKKHSAKVSKKALNFVKRGYTGNKPIQPDKNRFRDRAARIILSFDDKKTGETLYTATQVRKKHRHASTNLPNKTFVKELVSKHGYKYKEIQQVIEYFKYDWYYLLGYITKGQWVSGEEPSFAVIDKANKRIAPIYAYNRTKPQRQLKDVAHGRNFKKELYAKYKEQYLLQGCGVADAHRRAYQETGRFFAKHPEEERRFIESRDESVKLPSVVVMKANAPWERSQFGSKFHWQYRRQFFLFDAVRPFVPADILGRLRKHRDMNVPEQKEGIEKAVAEYHNLMGNGARIDALYAQFVPVLRKNRNTYARLMRRDLKNQEVDFKKFVGKKKELVTYVLYYVWLKSHVYASGQKSSFQAVVEGPGGEAFDVNDWDVTQIVEQTPIEWKRKMKRADVSLDVIRDWEQSGQMPNVRFTSRKSNKPYYRVSGSVVFEGGEHIHFSPKRREQVFTFEGKTEQDYKRFHAGMYRYLRAWALHQSVVISELGLSSDHVHCTVQRLPSTDLNKFIERLKSKMTEYLKQTDEEFGFYSKVLPPGMQSLYEASKQYWQKGYKSESFGETNLWQVEKYVREQLNKDHKRFGFVDSSGTVKDERTRKVTKELQEARLAQLEQEEKKRTKRYAAQKNIKNMTDKFLIEVRTNIRSYLYIPQGVDNSMAWKVLARAGFKCEQCGREYSESNLTRRRNLHIEHRKPLSEGGSNALSNLQALCVPCHKKKHPELAELIR